MEQLNRIELRGYVGAAKKTKAGDSEFLRFTIVTGYAYRTSDGSPVIENTWMDCLYFLRKDSGKVLPDLTKGDRVHLTGRLKHQRYTDSEGGYHDTYAVLVKELERYSDETALNPEWDS